MTMSGDFASAISEALPFLRRYGRALTGDQSTGDRYAATALEALLEDRSVAEQASSAKTGLFKVFHTIWKSSGAPVQDGETGLRATAQKHLSKLTEGTREALLLHTIEEFSLLNVAEIMQIEQSEAEHLISVARREMEDAVSGRIMIIEDEAIIAMDLENVVADMGHLVTGVARTRGEAVALAAKDTPDLILADIQLADNSSGVDAVNDILGKNPQISVIFITAFPERLLTANGRSPRS